MSQASEALQQNSQIPKLTGVQFDSNGDLVNLFRGSVSFPVQLLSLPGRNGLNFNLSLFYQSDIAISQVGEWNLDGASDIVGTGWSLPYEYIMVDPDSNDTLEDNQYYWVMGGQPTKLLPIQFGWMRGVLTSGYSSYLVPGPISSALQTVLFNQQIVVDPASILVAQGSNWELQDAANERLYSLQPQEDGSISVLTGGLSFELYNYQFWRISYYPLYERWEVTKNNGTTLTFGGSGQEIDSGTPANVLQYGIKWDNWIGPSSNATNQQQYVKAWNLAKVENTLGNYYIINYAIQEQAVGVGILSYAKNCVISKVQNDLGWSVVYQYADKTYDNTSLESHKEYLDPHKDPALSASALNTPDAYQSSYVTQYLRQLVVYNDSNEVQSYINLEYYDLWNPKSTAGSTSQEQLAYGATYGRYLKSVTQYPGDSYGYPDAVLDRYAAPGLLFNYCFVQDDKTKPQGLLTQVINANGGGTEFKYQSIETTSISRSLTISNPLNPDNPGTLRTWAGPDYIVTCWADEINNQINLNVYTWVGGWEKAFTDGQTLNQVGDLDLLQVIPSQNSFLVVISPSSYQSNTSVLFFNRSNLQNATWQLNTSTTTAQYTSNQIEVVSGNDFFLVQSSEDQVVDRYTWNPLTNPYASDPLNVPQWSKITYSIPSGKTYYMTAGTNYYVLFAYDQRAQTGVFTYYIQDLYNNWPTGATSSLSVSSITIPPLSIPGFNGFKYFQMSPAQSFVAMSIVTGYTLNSAGQFNLFDYEVQILTWDTNYTLSLATIDNLDNGQFANLPSSMLNGSPGIGPVPVDNVAIGSGPNYIFFDGVNWNCESVGVNYNGSTYPALQYYWYAYDEQGVIKTENTDSGILSVAGNIDPSNASSSWNTNTLLNIPEHVTNRYTEGYPTNGGQFITIGDSVYAKPLSSNWGDLTTQQILTIQDTLASDESMDTTTMVNTGQYLVFQILDQNQNPKDTGIIYFKNGTFVEGSVAGQPKLDRFAGQQIFTQFKANHTYKNITNGELSEGPNTIITYPSSVSSLDRTPSITLNRYSAQSFVETQYAFVAQAVTYSSGYETISNCYVYSAPRPAGDGTQGAILKFYQVTKYFGCTNPDDAENGYVVSNFYNGSPVDLLTGLLGDKYSILDGQLYEQVSYGSSSSVPVASSSMEWEVQTRVALDINETSFRTLHGGLPQVKSSTSMQDGLSTTVTSSFSLASGNGTGSTSSYYDSKGRNILSTTEVAYAYEKYIGMWYQNILSPQAQTIKYIQEAGSPSQSLVSNQVQTYQLWPQSGGGVSYWSTWKSYIPTATNSTLTPFTWWLGSGEPNPSTNGWIKTGEVLTRGVHGNVIASKDLEGIQTTAIYDTSDTFALATFTNATSADGISYTSFEDYQTNPWSFATTGGTGTGAITSLDALTGNQCYQLSATGGNTSSLNQTISVANTNQFYCFNFWYKTPIAASNTDVIALAVTAVGSSTPITNSSLPLTGGTWQPYQWVVNLATLGVTGPVNVTLSIKITSNSGPGYLRLDDIIFAPQLSPFMATAYDLGQMRGMGSIGANGVSGKPLYNMWGLYSNIGAYNQTTSLGTSSSVRQNPAFDPIHDSFPTATPNFSMAVSGRNQGFYDLFKSAESLNNYSAVAGSISNWNIVNGLTPSTNGISINTGTGDQVLEIANYSAQDVGIYLNVVPTFGSGTNPNQIMYLGVTETSGSPSRFRVQWNGTASSQQWALLKWNGTAYAPISNSDPGFATNNYTTSWQPEWLLTVFEDRLFFTANGILIFNYQDSAIALSPHTVQFGVNNPSSQGAVGFTSLTVVDDVQMSMSYKDGIGRTLQSLAVESSNSVIMVPAVYDGLGRAAISVLPSRIVQGSHSVTNPFAYDPNFITNGLDDGSSTSIWSNATITGNITSYQTDAGGYPFSRVVYETSPLGRPLQGGSPGIDYAITGTNTHITTYQYGINNDGDPGFLFALPGSQYYKTTVTDPDGKVTKQYSTTLGQVIGTIVGSSSNPVKSSQVYNMQGQVTASIDPKYYQTTPSPQTGIIPASASTFQYDFWGRKVQETYPDSGTSTYIYDNLDRIRFTQDAHGAASGYYNYMKYDVLGRAIEKGTCTGAINPTQANNPTWPTTGTTVSNTTLYDGNNTTPWMVGRTWKMNAFNGSGGDTAAITSSYTYRPTGEVLSKTQAAVCTGTPPLSRTDTMYYVYDVNGRLLSESDSVTSVVSQYSINKLGQLTETLANTGTKSVKGTYAYNQKGQLEATSLYKPNGTVLTNRAFTYLPKGSLTTTDDTYTHQQLNYTTGSCSSGGPGYYNGSLAHNTVNYKSPLPSAASDYCYTVDPLNRIIQAQNTGGTNYTWAFDNNSNFTTSSIGSENRTYTTTPNKNQLASITSTVPANNRQFSYNQVGDTTTVTGPTGATQLLNIVYNNWNGKARSITRPQTSTTSVFDYGPANGRVRKRVYNGPTVTNTLYNTGSLEIEIPSAGTTQTKRYIGCKGVGLIYRADNNTFYWALPDHLGSTRALIDELGNAQYTYNYDVYGTPTITKVNPSADIKFNFLYTGQYWDAELALYNYKARFYDPGLMRFLQVDPMRQFYNPYSYVGGIPNLFTDPSGMSAGGQAAGIITGLVVAAVLTGIFTFGIGAVVTSAVGVAAATVVAGAVVGGASALVTDVTTDAVDHQQENWNQIGIDVATGAIGGLIGGGAGVLGEAAAARGASTAAKLAIDAVVGGGLSSVAAGAAGAAMAHQKYTAQDAGLAFAMGFGTAFGANVVSHGIGEIAGQLKGSMGRFMGSVESVMGDGIDHSPIMVPKTTRAEIGAGLEEDPLGGRRTRGAELTLVKNKKVRRGQGILLILSTRGGQRIKLLSYEPEFNRRYRGLVPGPLSGPTLREIRSTVGVGPAENSLTLYDTVLGHGRPGDPRIGGESGVDYSTGEVKQDFGKATGTIKLAACEGGVEGEEETLAEAFSSAFKQPVHAHLAKVPHTTTSGMKLFSPPL